MTYAGGRRTLDADSHLMELPDCLDDFIEDAFKERLVSRRRGDNSEMRSRFTSKFEEAAEKRQADEAARAEAETRLLIDKGWNAMGAFTPSERSHVMDLFGFDGQLVFATIAAGLFRSKDLDFLYAGAKAHNRFLVDFCKDDPRLLPVAYCPLIDTDKALSVLTEAIEIGCTTVHVPSTAAGDRSPTHPDLDPVWDLLNESGMPFVLHVGGGGRLLDRAFHDNGRPVSDHLGGGENIRSKDFLAISNSPALFLGTLILDGIFDKFPNLRGAAIEEGASWVVSWMHQLDFAQRAFRRTEQPLQDLQKKPSEYVHGHLKFTPFPGEPVGWMIDQAGADLFMFSTDYPHPEGGRDPLTKFEETMGAVSDEDKDAFYYGNMAELLGHARTPVPA